MRENVGATVAIGQTSATGSTAREIFDGGAKGWRRGRRRAGRIRKEGVRTGGDVVCSCPVVALPLTAWQARPEFASTTRKLSVFGGRATAAGNQRGPRGIARPCNDAGCGCLSRWPLIGGQVRREDRQSVCCFERRLLEEKTSRKQRQVADPGSAGRTRSATARGRA